MKFSLFFDNFKILLIRSEVQKIKCSPKTKISQTYVEYLSALFILKNIQKLKTELSCSHRFA
jgi:hypothetical protein